MAMAMRAVVARSAMARLVLAPAPAPALAAVAARSGARAALRSHVALARPRVGASARWLSTEAGEAEAPTAEDEPKAEVSAEVKAIVTDILALNLLQVGELVSELNSKLNLPDMPMGGMMPMQGMAMAAGGAPAAGGAAAEEEPAEELKAIVSIQLDSFDAAAKIKIIKEVKNIAGLGLKEAKAAVEGAPGVIMSDVKRADAEAIVATLEGLGGKASLV